MHIWSTPLEPFPVSYKERLAPDAGAFTSSPWAYNGRIFCLSEEGRTHVLAAGPKFELLHVNALDEMALATPAAVGDRLLLRTEGRLYSIRKAGDVPKAGAPRS